MSNTNFENKNFTFTSDVQSSISPNDSFDLKKLSNVNQSLVNFSQVPQIIISEQEFQELRKLGVRIISGTNPIRGQALRLTNFKLVIKPYSSEHKEISILFNRNVDEMKQLVLLFKNSNGKYSKSRYPSRFTNKRIIRRLYWKAKKVLEKGFSKHSDAVMVTLTLPRIFMLSVPVKCCGRDYLILLQDSLLTLLKNRLTTWIRNNWRGRRIETFTDYEYHDDYALHHHIIFFGIPYLIDWSKKYGRKKEDALTYYTRKYGVEIPPGASKSEISKRIFTKLQDYWLIDSITKVGSLLGIDLKGLYHLYKQSNNIDGPINDVRRIKNGNWVDGPPPDGAYYSPSKYVIKYLTKIMNAVIYGYNIPEQHQAKLIGYWLYGKRFFSHSPSLGPPKEEIEEVEEESEWEFVGIFEEEEADEIIERNGQDIDEVPEEI